MHGAAGDALGAVPGGLWGCRAGDCSAPVLCCWTPVLRHPRGYNCSPWSCGKGFVSTGQRARVSQGWAALAHAPVSSGQGQGISLLSLEWPSPCPWPDVYSLFWGGADTPRAAEGPAAGEPQLPLWAAWQLWGEGAPCPWPPPAWWALRGAPAIRGRGWWRRSPHQCWHQHAPGTLHAEIFVPWAQRDGHSTGILHPTVNPHPTRCWGPHCCAIVVAVPVQPFRAPPRW